jgi:hypothetical protein
VPRAGVESAGSAIAELANIVRALDFRLNTHRVARYEFVGASRALIGYLTAGTPAMLADATARFTHVTQFLGSEIDRRRARQLVETLSSAVDSLTPDERNDVLALPGLRQWVEAALGTLAEETTRGRGVEVPESDRTDDRASLAAASADELQVLLAILRAIPRGLEHWSPGAERSAWAVSTERQVQSILWLALAPSLPALVWEENLQSVGSRRPRVDLALPTIGVVVEVKVIRRSADFSAVTEAISADAGLYTASDPTRRIVVFVWDQTRTSEHHATFRGGLMKFVGVLDVIVVSRPATMGTAESA